MTLHVFGSLAYAARLDTAPFLHQLCAADPFAWAESQMAQGCISEPDAWLLERYFLSRVSRRAQGTRGEMGSGVQEELAVVREPQAGFAFARTTANTLDVSWHII